MQLLACHKGCQRTALECLAENRIGSLFYSPGIAMLLRRDERASNKIMGVPAEVHLQLQPRSSTAGSSRGPELQHKHSTAGGSLLPLTKLRSRSTLLKEAPYQRSWPKLRQLRKLLRRLQHPALQCLEHLPRASEHQRWCPLPIEID